jgi:hypothetical protein
MQKQNSLPVLAYFKGFQAAAVDHTKGMGVAAIIER